MRDTGIFGITADIQTFPSHHERLFDHLAARGFAIDQECAIAFQNTQAIEADAF